MIQKRSVTDRLADGFPGQRMRVLPRSVVTQALRAPATGLLLVTDVGFFPHASLHGRNRPEGTAQNIVMVCAAGAGGCTLPGGTHRIRAGQALIIPAGTPHGYEADEQTPWTIWWMHVVGRGVGDLFEAIGTSAGAPVVDLADPARVVALFDAVIHHMERDESDATLVAAAGAAWHALALIAAGRRAPGSRSGDPIDATIEHLRTNAAGRISVAELAGMAGLSESHYSARFRQATGYAVLEYQTRLRMSRARELLDTTTMMVTSIAHQVGYPDALYFSRQFRRIHDMSPSEYRSRDTG